MDKALDGLLEAITWMGRLVLFIGFTIIFIPSFLVVNYLQKPWSEMFEGLFK